MCRRIPCCEKTGFRRLRSTGTASVSRLCWPIKWHRARDSVVILYRSRGAEDVVEFERFVDLAEPFGPVGSAAAAPLVEGQFQLAQQAGHLLARRHVTQARTGAKGCFVDVVERSQAARKKLAVNHAFGETIDRAEAEPERQLVEAVGDELLVARSNHRQSVADHDPVGRGAVELAALAAGVAHHLRIMAFAGTGI